MTAQLKSRVLVREEKGFGAVSMKRMIFSFMGSGFVFFLMRLTPFAKLNIPITLLSMVFFFYFTGDRYGVPRWRWMLMNGRGSLLVQARKSPNSFAGQICKTLKWDAHKAVVLKGADIFASASALNDDWSGLEILETDALDAGGFEVLVDEGKEV
jgi:hypothetical protein